MPPREVWVATMKMKTCPSCGEDIPTSAFRCKHCWHDFDAQPTSSMAAPILALCGAAAFLSVALAVVLGIMTTFPSDQRVTVSQETQAVVFTSQGSWGLSTDTLAFSDIDELRHVVTNSGRYQIVARLKSGSDRVLLDEERSLKSTTASWASAMDVKWREDNQARAALGFKEAQEKK